MQTIISRSRLFAPYSTPNLELVTTLSANLTAGVSDQENALLL